MTDFELKNKYAYNIACNLEKLMGQASIKNHKQLAYNLGLTPSTISGYFNGQLPTTSILIKLAKTFNVSVSELIGDSSKTNELQLTDEELVCLYRALKSIQSNNQNDILKTIMDKVLANIIMD